MFTYVAVLLVPVTNLHFYWDINLFQLFIICFCVDSEHIDTPKYVEMSTGVFKDTQRCTQLLNKKCKSIILILKWDRNLQTFNFTCQKMKEPSTSCKHYGEILQHSLYQGVRFGLVAGLCLLSVCLCMYADFICKC